MVGEREKIDLRGWLMHERRELIDVTADDMFGHVKGYAIDWELQRRRRWEFRVQCTDDRCSSCRRKRNLRCTRAS